MSIGGASASKTIAPNMLPACGGGGRCPGRSRQQALTLGIAIIAACMEPHRLRSRLLRRSLPVRAVVGRQASTMALPRSAVIITAGLWQCGGHQNLVAALETAGYGEQDFAEV